jgi:hypothetical protein
MTKKDMVREVANTFKCPNAAKGGHCESDFQDNRYGKGVRAVTTGESSRCTVCETKA